MPYEIEHQTGGYDEGYLQCPCFWGTKPGTFVKKLVDLPVELRGKTVLDLGCGEGKNAEYLAAHHAKVTAVDISAAALRNARNSHPRTNVTYYQGDARDTPSPVPGYDVVIMYGVLHCMRSPDEVTSLVSRLQAGTSPGGYHVVCAFNARAQDLSAHPGFVPLLLEHKRYLELYRDWELLDVSDSDLQETHPHNGVPHIHSMTRLLSRKKP